MWIVQKTAQVTVVAASAPDDAPGHAHALLTQGVSVEYGYPPGALSLVHRCLRCGSQAHGVPALTHNGRPLPLAASVSRASGIVLAGWGQVAGLGVDVERAGTATDTALDELLRHPSELPYLDATARTQAWVRKEAALKAWGSGLNIEPARVLIAGTTATTPAHPEPVELTDLVIDGYQASVGLRLGR